MATSILESAQTRKLPTRGEAVLFSAKAWGLRAQRWARDLQGEVRRWPQIADSATPWFATCESRTALWQETDESEKVQNLQVACARLNSVVIEAGGVFSFWRQMGRAGRRRGFTNGRMLQQGCLIPSVGGGLCQLSNALYELALLSGCEIIERHAHSARLPHMPLHDATVAWNYIDLRFRFRERTRLRAVMDARELRVSFESTQRPALGVVPVPSACVQQENKAAAVQSCASCGESACFRHRDRAR